MDGTFEPPRVSQDPNDPEFFGDPYSFYRKIRALSDFVYWEEYRMVVATTHAASAAIMKHPKFGRTPLDKESPDGPQSMPTFQGLEANSLLEIEPPRHTRLRRAAMQGFDKARIAAMAPEISRCADRLIDAFPEGEFDFIQYFAHPYPACVIARFFGLPDEMAPQLQSWSNDMVAVYQARRSPEIEEKAEQAAAAFSSYLEGIVQKRGALPTTDFLSDLIQAKRDGGIASSDELLSTVILLLNAGHEASVHALGHAVALLTDYPDRALALEPTNIANTVEECLRFAPPLHLFNRYAYENVRVLDHEFEAGQTVGCLLGSACRDDALWPDGDRFDPIRYRRSNLSFGSGIHACLGASLARLELQVALPAVFSRCPNLKVVETPRMSDRYHFHGLERLMIEIK